jgi:hypothetical protein
MGDAARLTLALLPLLATVAAAITLRPRNPRDPGNPRNPRNPRNPGSPDTIAPIRLAIVRGGVAVGAVAVAGIELLSTMDAIGFTGIVSLWVVVTAATLVGAVLRWPKSWLSNDFRPSWTLAGLAGLILAELVLAIASAPNNYDSNYYHLSKVEHWVADRDVAVYPTNQLQQVGFPPGGEYLLLHLRILTGGDHIYNLVQLAAGLGAAVAVSRIAAQLGAGRRGQLLSAAVLLTAPMVVLQSTSTQTDLIVAAWVAAGATLALNGFGRRSPALDVVLLGAAAGLCAVTKSTGLMGLAAMLLLWGGAQLRLGARFFPGTGGAAVTVLVIALLVVGPFLLRMQQTFGSPLGPAISTSTLSMQRHDPAAVLVNGLRMASSTLVIPIPAVNAAVAGVVMAVPRGIRIDPEDPAISLPSGKYPDSIWKPDEDHAPFPIQAGLILAAVAGSFVVRRLPGLIRLYGGLTLLAMVLVAAVVKWQLWGNRLLLTEVAIGAPLVGWWLDRLLGRGRRLASAAIVVVLVLSFAGAYGSVLLGQPRRLVGSGSVFTRTALEQRFAREEERLPGYRVAAAVIERSGARRIGLRVDGDQWEYPLWVMLPGRRFDSLASRVPGLAPANVTDLDAVVCIAMDCRAVIPADWHYVQADHFIAVGTR